MKIVNFQHGSSLPGPLPDLISQLSPTPLIDYESILTSSKRKLVLHFDINETILIGDEAGGDTVQDCLNKIIAKSAFVQCPPNSCSSETERCMNTRDYEPTHWWDGTPIPVNDACLTSPPPPLYTGWTLPRNCCSYYRTAYKKYAKTFTQGHGKAYLPLYQTLKNSLLSHDDCSGFSSTHPFYRMIPAFFYTLVKLQEMKKDYTLVLRTFGTDLDDVALALNDFANGKHPHYPSFREPRLILQEKQMFRGRYRSSKSSSEEDSKSSKSLSISESIYDLWEWCGDDRSSTTTPSKLVASGDDQVLNVIENLSVCGINDDYQYWDANKNAPFCGKPVWIHPSNVNRCDNGGGDSSSYHHLFFDDNIHNDERESIVAVRAWDEVDNCWKSLSGQETIDQQGKFVVRVPTIAAVLQQDWFLQHIALAEVNAMNSFAN